MNWEAIGSIGEVLGAVAVLVTLAYLAVQIRHSRSLLEENRRIALSQVYSSRASFRLEQLRHNIDSPYVAPVLAPAENLSEDAFRVREIYGRAVVHFDNILYQNELGLIPSQDMKRFTAVMVKNYDRWVGEGAAILPRVALWYEQHKDEESE